MLLWENQAENRQNLQRRIVLSSAEYWFHCVLIALFDHMGTICKAKQACMCVCVCVCMYVYLLFMAMIYGMPSLNLRIRDFWGMAGLEVTV